jgi:hypothetical protein
LEDKLLKLADSDTLQYCDCTGDGDGYQMIKQLTAARVVTDYPGYNCPITGAWIEGRAAHRENLAKHNCRVFEPGEMENTRRYMAKVDADMDKAVDATVDQFIAELPSDKRDKLAAEMDAGLDVQYTRQTVEA